MRVFLRPRELGEILSSVGRSRNNNLVLEIPDGSIERKAIPLVLTEPDTVRCGERSVKLSRTQYNLLAYLSKHRKATFNELRKHVWGRAATDRGIALVAHHLSEALVVSGICCAAQRDVERERGSIVLRTFRPFD